MENNTNDNAIRNEGEVFAGAAHMHFLKLTQTLSKLDLAKGQPPVLKFLISHDGCTQKQIAQFERKSPATMTVMLRTMEKMGYIKRIEDQEDRRIIRTYITDEGRAVNDRAEAALVKMNDEIFSVFTPEERDDFVRLLSKMEKRVLETLETK